MFHELWHAPFARLSVVWQVGAWASRHRARCRTGAVPDGAHGRACTSATCFSMTKAEQGAERRRRCASCTGPRRWAACLGVGYVCSRARVGFSLALSSGPERRRRCTSCTAARCWAACAGTRTSARCCTPRSWPRRRRWPRACCCPRCSCWMRPRGASRRSRRPTPRCYPVRARRGALRARRRPAGSPRSAWGCWWWGAGGAWRS